MGAIAGIRNLTTYYGQRRVTRTIILFITLIDKTDLTEIEIIGRIYENTIGTRL